MRQWREEIYIDELGVSLVGGQNLGSCSATWAWLLTHPHNTCQQGDDTVNKPSHGRHNLRSNFCCTLSTQRSTRMEWGLYNHTTLQRAQNWKHAVAAIACNYGIRWAQAFFYDNTTRSVCGIILRHSKVPARMNNLWVVKMHIVSPNRSSDTSRAPWTRLEYLNSISLEKNGNSRGH